jgi:hypothetical protein
MFSWTNLQTAGFRTPNPTWIFVFFLLRRLLPRL